MADELDPGMGNNDEDKAAAGETGAGEASTEENE